MTKFFLNRPKLAVVLTLALAAWGALSFRGIGLADYPEISPPLICVSASYPGASPQVLADVVATPIEAQILGVSGLYYFDSRSTDSGTYDLFVTFLPGTDPDIDLVNVQNAVKRAEPKLPAEVKQSGLTIIRRSSDYELRYLFRPPEGDNDLIRLGNVVNKEIKEALQLVSGVSNVSCTDREYAMRIWLDSNRMDALGVTVAEVKEAIQRQNIQPAAGFVGDSFSSGHLAYKINARGRLVSSEEFAQIVVRTDARTGARILLGDLARCELGAKSYSSEPRLNGEIAYAVAVYADFGSNSKEVCAQCRAIVDRIARRTGVRYELVYDKSAFSQAVLGKLALAVGLMLLLLGVSAFVFLGGARAFAIVIAVSVVSELVGCGVLSVFGYTVDLVTGVGGLMALAPVALCAAVALRTALDGSPSRSERILFAAALVTVVAVLPLTFGGGMVGLMHVRFAVAFAAPVVASAFLSSSVVPILAQGLGRGRAVSRASRLAVPVRAVSRPFARHPVLVGAAMALIAVALALTSCLVPKGFVPGEDRGYVKIEVELSEGATLSRTRDVLVAAVDLLKDVPGVTNIVTVSGTSLVGKIGESHGEIFLHLLPWTARPTIDMSVVAAEAERRLANLPVAEFTVINPTPISGMGGYGGVMAFVCTTGDVDPQAHAADIDAYAASLRTRDGVHSAITTFSANTPQLMFSVDRDKAQALGVDVATVYATLQSKLASFYVNDFNLAGGAHQVIVQNEPDARASVTDAEGLLFPGSGGALVPLSAVGCFRDVLGPRVIPRYCNMPSAGLVVSPKKGCSAREVIEMIETDPPDASKYQLGWSLMTREEISTRGRFVWMVGLAFLFVYLALAATFESWWLPLRLLVAAAVAVGGSFAGLFLAQGEQTMFSQLVCVSLVAYGVLPALIVHELRGRVALSVLVAGCLGATVALCVPFALTGVGVKTLLALSAPAAAGVISAMLAAVIEKMTFSW